MEATDGDRWSRGAGGLGPGGSGRARSHSIGTGKCQPRTGAQRVQQSGRAGEWQRLGNQEGNESHATANVTQEQGTRQAVSFIGRRAGQ